MTPQVDSGDSQAAWQRQFSGGTGMIFAFAWGLAEATLFFIIPDVFLSFVAVIAWPRSWRHVVAAIAGALLGGALLFHLAATDQVQARRVILRVPFIRESMLVKVDDGLRNQGMAAILFGSLSGVPYKLYAVEAPRFFNLGEFLAATPPVRAVRFFLVWLGFGGAATWLRKRRGWQTARLMQVHAAIWIVCYAFYWGRIVL